MDTITNDAYQEVIKSVSGQIAREFLRNETNLEHRALLLDADIAEITRQIGLETTKIVIGDTLDRLTEKKKLRGL